MWDKRTPAQKSEDERTYWEGRPMLWLYKNGVMWGLYSEIDGGGKCWFSSLMRSRCLTWAEQNYFRVS